MTPLSDAQLAELLKSMFDNAGYACDDECEGRCKVCPADVMRQAANAISQLRARLAAAEGDARENVSNDISEWLRCDRSIIHAACRGTETEPPKPPGSANPVCCR